MTVKQLLCMPFVLVFWASVALFLLPFAVPFVLFKTFGWLVGTGMGWEDSSWSDFVFEEGQ